MSAETARPVVLIDGRSGSGKTTLGRALAQRLGARLVSLDEVYPGWDGLAAAARAVPRMLAADRPGFRSGPWGPGGAGTWNPIDPSEPLVVEGCGALTRRSRRLATLGVWLEAPTGVRRRRALRRDPAFAVDWARWAAQERAHFAREHPRVLADRVLRLSSGRTSS
ncbi:MAG: (d)CMP kinase [Actinomycetales bacterium]|nr:(d)CMP kinase [Actinomycetales bacterium]